MYGCNIEIKGHTFNKEYYRLREAIRRKRTELGKNQSWILLVHEILIKNKNVIMPQPPLSSDLVSADFFLFPKLKTPIKGKRFLFGYWQYQNALFKSVSRIEEIKLA